jgi:hypothetical protein
MRRSTIKNGAPVWELTITAVQKGRELAIARGADPEVVVLALYLAHIRFSNVVGDEIQVNHPDLSAESARKYLERWKVSVEKRELVLESIRAHHRPGKPDSLEAEVMKNAECYKFITWDKLKLYYNDLLKRGYTKEKAVELVRLKFEQKKAILTFSECTNDAEKGYLEIDRELQKLV